MKYLGYFRYKAHRNGKLTVAVFLLLYVVLTYLSLPEKKVPTGLPKPFKSTDLFLINTSNCKIPNLNPFNDDVLPFLKLKKYEPCFKKPLLSYIETKGDSVILKVNESAFSTYTFFKIECCYSKIFRVDGDRTISYSPCQWFQRKIIITYPYIRVMCKNFFGIIYRNVHATVIPSQHLVSAHTTTFSNTTTKSKIFMLGIDSVSRLNLQRTMPKVYTHLEKNFVGFKGYNKVADNTFPNLMAILTGRSWDTLAPICLPTEYFDNCDLMLNTFKRYGFTTAYGEDHPSIHTFNYYKKGFLKEPTDFYLRPYFVSAYLLPTTYKHLWGVCSGPENSAERVLNAAKNFEMNLRNHSTFSLFWLNSFSHDDINLPLSMDDRVFEFLEDTVLAHLNNSIIVVFSDHGFRFGDIRYTYTGWLEERLPFLYFRFPKFFQEKYPELYNNFVQNAVSRLTSPFDVFMTLQHLLKLVNDSYNVKPSLGCPTCKSLFTKIEENRDCKNAAINKHWCTCEGYTTISNKTSEALLIGTHVLNYLNHLIKSFKEEGYKCAKYKLSSVEAIANSTTFDNYGNVKSETYLILIKTYPYAMFEATIKRENEHFEVLGDISRLSRYRDFSSCVHNDQLKKICFCNDWLTKIISVLCYLFSCPVF